MDFNKYLGPNYGKNLYFCWFPKMLTKVAHIIIKYRLALVIFLGVFTAFMAYKAKDVEMNYSFIKAVPDDDEDMQFYQKFQDTFGEDGNVIVVGFDSDKVFRELNNFKKFSAYVKDIEAMTGVVGVLAVPNLIYLHKDKKGKKFVPRKIFDEMPGSQLELDSMLQLMSDQKFYEGQLLNSESGASLLAITITKECNESKQKDILVAALNERGALFEKEVSTTMHYAGLPYLRSWKAKKVSEELRIFLILSLIVTALVLLFFFRSFYSVAVPMVIIAMMVIWSMGTIVLMGYQMSILTGLIPPIIVVIGIPNSVYLINKYHQEFRKHGNKIKALSLIIRKIGIVTFITNLTTAIGFLVVTFTKIGILQEFGLVAGLNILGVFLATIILIPALFAYLPEPKSAHLKHLDFKFFKKVLSLLDHFVHNRKAWVYGLSGVALAVSLYGVFLVKPVSYMLDDLPEDSKISKDLKFFENNFSGVMPFEIIIDTKKKNGVIKLSTIKKLDRLEKRLAKNEEFSAPLSIVAFTKVFSQAFYKNNPKYYKLPSNQDKNFILSYVRKGGEGLNDNNRFTDSTGQFARISMRVEDIGSIKLDSLVKYRVEPAIDSVFSESDFEVKATGTTLIFTKGNKFIIDNLRYSLLIAFVLIGLIMAALFGSGRMIIISMIPNIIPLIITGGIMGYFGIALKPSTALIFSIAFGISVDDSIHYLAKYRQELFTNNFNVSKAVSMSIKETGSSMIYTSIILFFGFIIFAFSEFGGTIALGILTSITLFFALVTNLTLLPTLLLSFDNGKRKKRRSNFLLVDQYDYDEEEFETSEEIDEELLTVKVKGEVFDPIYEKEVEQLKRKKDSDSQKDEKS